MTHHTFRWLVKSLFLDSFIEGEPNSEWFFKWLDGAEPQKCTTAMARELAIREGRGPTPKGPLTAEIVRAALHYDVDTGVFTWRDGTRRAGMVAGFPRDGERRYRGINICGRYFVAHRVAWLYVMGSWPEQVIDHIDGDGLNNRFANLRDVSNSVNLQNQRRPRNVNKTGFLGVSRIGKEFLAQIEVGNKGITLGRFSTAQEAHSAYVTAKRKLHIGCSI